MNRWQMENMRKGLAQELSEATKKMTDLYGDASTTVAQRQQQKTVVEDLKERLKGINEQIKAEDDAASEKLKTQKMPEQEGDARLKAKAALYRAVLHNKPAPAEHMKALGDSNTTGGEKFLPKTVSSQIVTEPQVTNPLRGISTVTNITNLEVPKLAFTLDDDEFVEDTQTAKEIQASGDSVVFGRNKFKVFVDISETVLLGTDADLVGFVDRGLESGLAKKEKKVAFAQSPSAAAKHMSFYAKTNNAYEIKETNCISGTSLYDAILAAIGDLEEDYRENAKIVMRFSDYLSILKTLANGNATLYGVQPEQILGKPVVFCDMAETPVVGDFSYSHYNYDLGMQYERDKNVKTGLESFVLTAWFDHQIKMKSAFRLVTIQGGVSQ